MDTLEAVKLWRELGVVRATMPYSCGGDSMGSIETELYDADDEQIQDSVLEGYFDDVVYNEVEFYVNSDGHYMGEAGTVEIELDGSGEHFNFNKVGQYEYNESYTSKLVVEVTEPMADFIQDKVRNINGGSDEFAQFNYKKDFLMTDEVEELISELRTLVDDETKEYIPEDAEGELDEWFNFTTNEDGDELKIEGNKLTVIMTNYVTTYKDE